MMEFVNLADATVIKSGNAFCVAQRDGCLPLVGDHPLGVYLDDCRYLRGRELWIGGKTPRLLSATDAAGTVAVFELTAQSLRVRVERRMLAEGMLERITLRSDAREPVELDLELRLDADFRPMLEVRGLVAPSTRPVRRVARDDTLRFEATGLDGRERSTTITCPAARAGHDGRLRVELSLDPGDEPTLDVRYRLAGEESRHSARHERLAELPCVEVDDELVDRALQRSLLDLRLLDSTLDGRRYYAAGVPWYATLFGRDSIIAALQMLAFDPGTAGDTLRLLAGRLGSEFDAERDEEPGKVLHELRQGELAQQRLTPFARYYGTVDATPLFLCLLCEHAEWTGSPALFRELRPEIDRTLEWIDTFGDLDGDGLLEYRRRSPGGLANQGWKDSSDGIVDEHGAPLPPPIALVEVQAYAAAAKQRLARLFELEGETDRADELRAGAGRLCAGLERFWLADRCFYAMALDREKRPSRALASNQGHLLWAHAISGERAGNVRDALLGDDAYSGWGVRTLGAGERAFNPVGYHAGTIWPHDNAFLGVGLRSYGFDAAFLRIFENLLDAAARFPDHRLPELFGGFSRSDDEDPVPYPVACRPQAWAAGSLPYMLTAGLGLEPDGLQRTLRIRRPLLPRQVSRLSLKGLRVADARVDLLFERVAGRPESAALTKVDVDGRLDVVLERADC